VGLASRAGRPGAAARAVRTLDSPTLSRVFTSGRPTQLAAAK
jgi:hypothetical protein